MTGLVPPLISEQYPLDSIDDVLGLVENAAKGGQTHICVLTHLKSTRRNLQELLTKALADEGYLTFGLDGDMLPDKRIDVLNDAVSAAKAVVFCTMHSVKEGINELANFTRAIFAELYWSPVTVVQSINRFQRLSSAESCNVTFCYVPGTAEEQIVSVLLRRVAAVNDLIGAGDGEEAIQGALTVSDDDLMEDFAGIDMDSDLDFFNALRGEL